VNHSFSVTLRIRSQRMNSRRNHLDGCRRSRIKPLLNLARPFLSLITHQHLPNIVDLRSSFSSIDEQYSMGSCVGSALASIFEYFHFYTTGNMKRFSRLFIYYNARMMEDHVSQRNATEFDSGADLQFAIVSLIEYGCCEEEYWPFYEHLINQQPNHAAYVNGKYHRLHEFNRLSNNIYQLRQCLAQGYPFVMAIRIFPSFSSDHRGYIPMPRHQQRASQYRHAVVCVGYIHSERVFIIRNSHGIHWGDHGYGYLPYDYVTDKILSKDLWAIKSIDHMTMIYRDQPIEINDIMKRVRSNSQADLLATNGLFSDKNDEFNPFNSNDNSSVYTRDSRENDTQEASPIIRYPLNSHLSASFVTQIPSVHAINFYPTMYNSSSVFLNNFN
jgi:C1A family cysteine protease